nr:hypothetical protein [Leptospira ryugenii]
MFFGFEFENVRIETKEPFPEENLLQAKRLALRYQIPMLLLAKLKVSEIALESAEIHLHERNQIWNFATLLKPSDEKKEEEEPKEPLSSLRTWIPVAAEAHLSLKDVRIDITKESQPNSFVSIEDLNFRFDLVTNRFTNLPFDYTITEQIDQLYLGFNPERAPSIQIETKDLNWKQSLPIGLLLDWNRDRDKNPHFLFTSKIGSEQIQFTYKNKPVTFGAVLSHHIEYFPEEDKVIFRDIALSILGDRWLQIAGLANNVTKDNRHIDIAVTESKINLEPLHKLLLQLDGIVPKIALGGNVSFSGTTVKGTGKETIFSLVAIANQLSISSSGKTHQIPTLLMNLGLGVDFSEGKSKSAEDPFPWLQSFFIDQCQLQYNGIKIDISGLMDKGKQLDLDVSLENLRLVEYVSMLGGTTKAKVLIRAKDFSNLPVQLALSVERFRYSLDRSRSPDSWLGLFGDIRLFFSGPFQLAFLSIPKFTLNQKTLSGADALALQFQGDVRLGEEKNINIKPLNLSAKIPFLLQTVPLFLKEKIAPLQSVIGDHPELKIDSNVLLNSKYQKVILALTGKIPGLELSDLSIKMDLLRSLAENEKIQINSFQMTGYENILSLKSAGSLEKKGGKSPLGPYFGNLDLNLSLKSSTKKNLLKGISFSGNVNLSTKIKDFDIIGEFQSDHSNIHQTNHKCPGLECKAFLVEDLDAKIPFHHSLNWTRKESLIVGDKSQFIKNYGRTLEPNLKIGQIIGTHPSIPDLPFEYVKRQGTLPGFSARIDYQENYASIESLKAYTLDGLVFGKNIVFNVGTSSPSQMEFRGNLQIRDIDLKQLMAPKVRDKIADGKLKADLNISVRDLTEPVANMDLFFSIFQIGSDFGKSALNVISPQNFLIDRIADSYAVNTIDISLSKGLVYADVFFRRSILSVFINLEDSKISQQRMPLANFLKRARSEIETYQ